jgi:hypothetical protein
MILTMVYDLRDSLFFGLWPSKDDVQSPKSRESHKYNDVSFQLLFFFHIIAVVWLQEVRKKMLISSFANKCEIFIFDFLFLRNFHFLMRKLRIPAHNKWLPRTGSILVSLFRSELRLTSLLVGRLLSSPGFCLLLIWIQESKLLYEWRFTANQFLLARSPLRLLTYSRSWVLLEKPVIAQLFKNFPAFYGTRRFNTVFTRALHWSLS